MPSSVTIFIVTKFRPGQQTMTFESTIFIRKNPSRDSLNRDAKYHAQECHRSLGQGRMRTRRLISAIVLSFVAAIFASIVRAEDGHEAWLRYAPLDPTAAKRYGLPSIVKIEGDSVVMRAAREELIRGLNQMLGVKLAPFPSGEAVAFDGGSILLTIDWRLAPESFHIYWVGLPIH